MIRNLLIYQRKALKPSVRAFANFQEGGEKSTFEKAKDKASSIWDDV